MRFLLFLFFALIASTSFAADLTLTTHSFIDQGGLPVMYTCDGKDMSPELTWNNAPANTKSFAIIMSDPDAPGGTWYHWVIYNLPAATTSLVEGMSHLPAEATLAENSWHKAAYNGPCPPKGSVHHYIFTLYALDAVLTVPVNSDNKAVLEAMKSHVLKQSVLTAVYSH